MPRRRPGPPARGPNRCDRHRPSSRCQKRDLLISPDAMFHGQIEQLAALTVLHSLPAIYQFREFPVAGGLMSYGTIHTDPYRLAGVYAGKILGGANPANLPVQQPTAFELVINLKTAKVLGL